MATKNKASSELEDLNEKARSAKKAANAPNASEREKADSKLAHQEALGEKLRGKREDGPAGKTHSEVDAKLDKALKDSFPGSDPVSFVQAAGARKEDEGLSTVQATKGKRDK